MERILLSITQLVWDGKRSSRHHIHSNQQVKTRTKRMNTLFSLSSKQGSFVWNFSEVCRVIHHHYGLLCHVNCSFLTQFFFFLNLSVTCWLAVGRLSVTCRPTVDRQSADRFFGELFFTITWKAARFVSEQDHP